MNKLFDIQYFCHNKYEKEVNDAFFEYIILPCNDSSQTLLEYSLEQNMKEVPFIIENSFGFKTLRIRPHKPFKEITLTIHAIVEKKDNELIFQDEISPARQNEILQDSNFYIDNYLFIQKTPLTSIDAKNREFVLKKESLEPVFNFLTKLNEYVYTSLEYKPEVTTVETSADEVIGFAKGVCQDFAHVFISIARANGIPCRYTSGYVDQGKNHVGSAMMHAWVEAFIPGTGWVGFDPTNNLQVDSGYIKVCHGRDYSDCSPIKGILFTTGRNETSHKVIVVQQ
ncbi:MAG: transglutaminase-like domain-containing protein [Cytophagaceae bacterium]